MESKRNYGIDVLRLFTMFMFMIIIFHILNHGWGANDASTNSSLGIIWAFEALTCCSVDCFAIISGYVLYNNEDKPWKYSRYISLWLQVVVYSVLLNLLVRGYAGFISVKEITKAFLPVTTSQYWYFTAYTGVFFLAPYVNKLIRQIEQEKVEKTFLIFAIGVMGYVSIVGILYDPFKVMGGYSCLWLILLYVLGAFAKKV